MKSTHIVGDSKTASRNTAERLERRFREISLQVDSQPERSILQRKVPSEEGPQVNLINNNPDTNLGIVEESNSPCFLTSVTCNLASSACPGATTQEVEGMSLVKDIIRRLGILSLDSFPEFPSKTRGFTILWGPETSHQKSWAEREGRRIISEPLHRYYGLTTEEITKLMVEGIPQYINRKWKCVVKALYEFSNTHPYVTYDDGVIGPLFLTGQEPAGMYLCGVPISKYNSPRKSVHVLNYGPNSDQDYYRHICALLVWIHAYPGRSVFTPRIQSRVIVSSHHRDQIEAKKVKSVASSKRTPEKSLILSAVVRAQQHETKISTYKPAKADYSLANKLYKLYQNGSLDLEEIIRFPTVNAMRETVCAISDEISSQQTAIMKGREVVASVPRHHPTNDYYSVFKFGAGAPKASSSMRSEKGFPLIKQRKIDERGILTTLSTVLQESVPDNISSWSDDLNGFYTSAARIGCTRPEELAVWVPTLRIFIRSASKDEAMNLSTFFANMASISSELWEGEMKSRLRPRVETAASNDYVLAIAALIQRENMVELIPDSWEGEQIRGEVFGVPSICGVAMSAADVYLQIAEKLQKRFPLYKLSDLPVKLGNIKDFLVGMKSISSIPEGSQASQTRSGLYSSY